MTKIKAALLAAGMIASLYLAGLMIGLFIAVADLTITVITILALFTAILWAFLYSNLRGD